MDVSWNLTIVMTLLQLLVTCYVATVNHTINNDNRQTLKNKRAEIYQSPRWGELLPPPQLLRWLTTVTNTTVNKVASVAWRSSLVRERETSAWAARSKATRGLYFSQLARSFLRNWLERQATLAIKKSRVCISLNGNVNSLWNSR